MLGVLFGLVLIATLLWNVAEDVIVGRPVVTSGSTIRIGGSRISLWGARAPAIEDSCDVGGICWACGAYAFTALYARVAGRSVWCIAKQRQQDVVAAQCFVGFTDVGQQMVELGWAQADVSATPRYIGSETQSRRARRGMWSATESLDGRAR